MAVEAIGHMAAAFRTSYHRPVTASPEPPVASGSGPEPDVDPPMLPSRRAYVLAFLAVVLAGILGAVIGFGVVDVGSDNGVATFVGAVVGAVIGAGGVGIVAVLVLRAMAEWKLQPRPAAPVRRRS
jgi:hypothetical protein